MARAVLGAPFEPPRRCIDADEIFLGTAPVARRQRRQLVAVDSRRLPAFDWLRVTVTLPFARRRRSDLARAALNAQISD